jgi:hypothetical protein
MGISPEQESSVKYKKSEVTNWYAESDKRFIATLQKTHA